MDGLYVNGKRPASKKAVKAAIEVNPANVVVEATSIMGGFSGSLANLPIGHQVSFVGPDPRNKRNFYGTIERITSNTYKVS